MQQKLLKGPPKGKQGSGVLPAPFTQDRGNSNKEVSHPAASSGNKEVPRTATRRVNAPGSTAPTCGELPKKTPPRTDSANLKPQEATKPNTSRISREHIINALFTTFDKDCNDILSEAELHAFAESAGFDGNYAQWQTWYKNTMNELQAPLQIGVNRAQFNLVCQDADFDDLLDLVGEDEKAMLPIPIDPQVALRKVFAAYDRNGDERLNLTEMRQLCEKIGWLGSDEDWINIYASICALCSVQDVMRGLTCEQLGHWVYDTCLEDDLQSICREVTKKSGNKEPPKPQLNRTQSPEAQA